MDRKSSRLESWDKRYLWHPFTQHHLWEKEPTLIVKSGSGVFLDDFRGKKYLDGVSSLWVNLHGHQNPVLKQAIRIQLSKIAHSTFFGISHEQAILLGIHLAQVFLKGLTRYFFSDIVVTAVKVIL